VLLCWVTWSLIRRPLVDAGALLTGWPAEASQPAIETALVGGCAAALLCCVLWGVVLTLLSVVGLVGQRLAPGSRRVLLLARHAERRCPALVRRLAATALGVTMGAGAAIPALAAIQAPPRPVPLTGLRLPDRATGTGLVTTPRPVIGRASPAPSSSGSSRRPPRFVDVRPGDSLWLIAQRQLAPGASDLDITRAWHHIRHANAARIGGDPDLIHPGTRLAVPPLASHPRKEHS
jgi:hypothetical protein